MGPLRQYQIEAIEKIAHQFFHKGVDRLLIEHPTGTGKTVLAASLLLHPELTAWLSQFPEERRRVLFLAHRRELLEQAARTFRTLNPSLVVEIEQADERASSHADILVASVATLAHWSSSRLDGLNPDAFRIVIVDEAHHAVARQYRKILGRLGFSRDNPSPTTAGRVGGRSLERLLVGVTATPNRSDGVALASVFDQIAHRLTLPEAVEAGFLCRLRAHQIVSCTSLDDVSVTAGDFSIASLARTVNTTSRNASVLEAYTAFGEDRPALVFAVDVAHAVALADVFTRAGHDAASVTGQMPAADRNEALRRFKTGDLKVLTNCMVLTEGFDAPSLACIVMARPTGSPVLYRQMIGRGTRLAEGKSDCLILDILDNTTRHSLVTMGSLLGLEPRHQFGGADVFDAQTHRRSVEERFGDDYDIPNDLSLGSLRLLSLPVALWPTDGPLPWIRSSRGALVIESPQRARLERFVVREEPRGWVVNIISLCGRSVQIAGFERPIQFRRRFGLDLPTVLARPFPSCAAAQAAVEGYLLGRTVGSAPVSAPPARDRITREAEESSRRLEREAEELAQLLDFDGHLGRTLRDPTLAFWTPPQQARRVARLSGRTRFIVANGAILFTATAKSGETVCFGQLLFGHGFYDMHIRTAAGKACMERCERVLKSFSLAQSKIQPATALSDCELGKWVQSALGESGIAHEPCPLHELL